MAAVGIVKADRVIKKRLHAIKSDGLKIYKYNRQAKLLKGGETMQTLKTIVADKYFWLGVLLGFALGVLHHYYAL